MKTNNKTLQLTPHFISLGGAGRNALEHIYKMDIYGKYTCIDFPNKSKELYQDVDYISYTSPMQRNKIPVWLNPEEIDITAGFTTNKH